MWQNSRPLCYFSFWNCSKNLSQIWCLCLSRLKLLKTHHCGFGQNRCKTCPIQIPFINARHLQMFIPSDDPVYYICIPLYTSTTWYDDMWRKNNNIIHSIQWSLERTIYNPKIWCYDQNDNALWYILTTILMPWLFLSWKRKKKSI